MTGPRDADTGLHSIGELMGGFMAAMEHRRAHPLVELKERLDNGMQAVIFHDDNHPGFEYDFYVRDFEDALQWVARLTEKSWVTTEHLQVFAALMLRVFGRGRR